MRRWAIWMLVSVGCGAGFIGGCTSPGGVAAPPPAASAGEGLPAGLEGADGPGPTGSFTVRVTWPEVQAELVPVAAASVKLTVAQKSDGAELESLLLTQDDPSGATGPLPTGLECTLTAVAHPERDGTGTPQARGAVDATVPNGTTAAVGLTMASTIKTITVTPADATVGLGDRGSLTATALDAEGNVVLVRSTFGWASSNTKVATVQTSADNTAGTDQATVSGESGGEATITVTDRESEVSGTARIGVPRLALSTKALSFGETSNTLSFSLANVGGGTLAWRAADTRTWITLAGGANTDTSGAGVVSGTGGATLQVGVDRWSGLGSGRHAGGVGVDSNGGPAAVDVDVAVPWISWATNREGNYEIYRVSADGKLAANMTRDKANDRAPAWSRAAGTLAYCRMDLLTWDVYTSGLANFLPVNLTKTTTNELWPDWSPNGGHIAFQSHRNGNGEVYVMRADGSAPANLTKNDALDGEPDWAPDGKSIAFVSNRDGVEDVFVMASTGASPANLTRGNGESTSPDWGPGGKHIAFTSTRDGDQEIYIMEAIVGGKSFNLTRHSKAQDYQPTWSPDGLRLLFVSTRSGNADIWMTDLSGDKVVQFTTSTAADVDPAWAPAG